MRRVHGDKNSPPEKPRRNKHSSAQEGAVASSMSSGISPITMAGTYMIDGDISQPAQASYVTIVKPGSHGQVPSSIAQSMSFVQ